MPTMNLSEPGWTLRQGQAVWQPRREAPEIAGDLVLATRTNGDAFVQFSKTPLALAIARKSGQAWQAEFPAQNIRYSGRGKPPARIIWFPLARAVIGSPPAPPWSWQRTEDRNWRLENVKTGETLAGFFAP